MIRNPRRLTIGLLLVVLLVGGFTIGVHAAVGGEFSSSYDAAADNEDPGRDIAVSGTIEFTGSNAVNPRIEIRETRETVLESSSVNVLVGESAVDFSKRYGQESVILSTDEIPAGTEIRLEYDVYSKGVDQSNISASNVIVHYETPEGESLSKEFTVYANLSNSPSVRLNDLSERNSQLQAENSQLQSQVETLQSGGGADWQMRFMVLLGLVVIGIFGVLGIWYWNNQTV